MGCDCGKPKCDGHCGVSPAVLQINNPSECVLFHRVEVPASMGDSTTNPPKPGAYKNTLLYYKADGEAFLYSSDGIPTKVTGVANDYACLENKPQINGVTLEGNKSLADIGVTDAIDNALEDYTPTSEFAEVAFTGDYDDLENTPTPPVTHFYRHGSGGIEDSFPFYNDADFTDQTTYQQFEDAILSGPVQVFDEYDAHAYTIGNVEMMNAEVGYNVAFWVSGEKERQVFRWMYTDSAPVLESVESYSYQPDWNVNNPNSFAYIRNKPTIPTVNDATLTIQKEGSPIGTFTANSATNATVNVVETDPTVPSWAKQPTKPTYSYSEITDKPTIPTKTSDLTNDGSDGTSTYVESDDLATVATSGSYNDLSNKPTIPAAQVNSDWNAASGVAQILNKPSLATVATSGSYSDLSGAPSVVQAVGTSTTNVMSQNAVTGLIYYDPSTQGTISIGTTNGYEVTGGIQIGDGALAPEDYSIAVGYNARGSDGGYPYKGIAIGANAYVWSEGGVAIGADTNVQIKHSVAIGDKSYVGSRPGNEYVVSVGRPSDVSNPFTRRIVNVTDPIDAQDAATKNYVDTIVGNIETILQTLNSGTGV